MIKNAELWTSYKRDNDEEARKSLILNYLDLVKYQAQSVEKFVPNSIEKGDLESYGILGLMDAIEKFEPERGNKFISYAQLRIRGAIIDNLRKLDWLPHSLRRKAKIIKRKARELANEIGHTPDIDLLARELGMSRKEIEATKSKVYESEWISLYSENGDSRMIDYLADTNNEKPENLCEKEIMIDLLTEAINNLDEQEKLVVSLYYYKELTQVEIAEIMEISQARVSQIHKNAIYHLRELLNETEEQLI